MKLFNLRKFYSDESNKIGLTIHIMTYFPYKCLLFGFYLIKYKLHFYIPYKKV